MTPSTSSRERRHSSPSSEHPTQKRSLRNRSLNAGNSSKDVDVVVGHADNSQVEKSDGMISNGVVVGGGGGDARGISPSFPSGKIKSRFRVDR